MPLLWKSIEETKLESDQQWERWTPGLLIQFELAILIIEVANFY